MIIRFTHAEFILLEFCLIILTVQKWYVNIHLWIWLRSSWQFLQCLTRLTSTLLDDPSYLPEVLDQIFTITMVISLEDALIDWVYNNKDVLLEGICPATITAICPDWALTCVILSHLCSNSEYCCCNSCLKSQCSPASFIFRLGLTLGQFRAACDEVWKWDCQVSGNI